MQNPEFKSYCFEQPAQWRAGVLDNWQVGEDGLAVPGQLAFAHVTETVPDDATPALVCDPAGNLYWVRDAADPCAKSNLFRATAGILFRLTMYGPQKVGQLVDGAKAKKLALGNNRLWLSRDNSLLRYTTHQLQLAGSFVCDRTILTITPDGEDGVWLLLGGDGHDGELVRYDAWGQEVATIKLNASIARADMTTLNGGSKLAILDPESAGKTCKVKPVWRLWLIDTRYCKVIANHEFQHRTPPAFNPTFIAADHADQIHVLDKTSGQLWTLNCEGEILARRLGLVPASWRQLKAIAAHRDIFISGQLGIAGLYQTDVGRRTDMDRVSIFISPTLVSPEGKHSGWLRADIGAALPEGTTLEISHASTRDRSLARMIDRLLSDSDLTSSDKVDELERRLPWHEGQKIVYTGSDTPTLSRLRYPLHEITDTHLWLRLVCYTPPGAQPPKLHALQVFYPNLSYLRYLPEVYQEDPVSAKQLRQFITLFESLFGDLDAELAELPRCIDPQTAPEEWIPFLLRWLGLPAATELDPDIQRRLLKAAPELLRNRGTEAALQRLLDILADGKAAVDDLGAGPAPWVLARGTADRWSARLGRDTLVLAQEPPAFRLGQSSQLNNDQRRLGYGRTDPKQLFARRSSEVHIRVAADNAAKAQLEPVIRRFLPYFVPAHCRWRLIFVAPESWPKVPRLDLDYRLRGKVEQRLGTNTVVGKLCLPHQPPGGSRLGRTTVLDHGIHLT